MISAGSCYLLLDSLIEGEVEVFPPHTVIEVMGSLPSKRVAQNRVTFRVRGSSFGDVQVAFVRSLVEALPLRVHTASVDLEGRFYLNTDETAQEEGFGPSILRFLHQVEQGGEEGWAALATPAICTHLAGSIIQPLWVAQKHLHLMHRIDESAPLDRLYALAFLNYEHDQRLSRLNAEKRLLERELAELKKAAQAAAPGSKPSEN